MKKQTIAIDMDDVMTDAVGQFIKYYQNEFGEDISEVLRKPGNKIKEVIPADKLDTVMGFPHRKEFFKDMVIKENCREVIEQLHQKYDVYVVTAAMEFELCLTDKLNWLKDNLPFITWHNIVFCGDKSIIGTDYLIDDLERNLKSFKGTPIVFTAPHNADLTEYTRVNSWQEVADYFLK